MKELRFLFDVLMETSTTAVFVYQDDILLASNSAAQLFTGHCQEDLSKKSLWDIVCPDDHLAVRHVIASSLEADSSQRHCDARITTQTGERRWAVFSAAAIRSDEKQLLLIFVVALSHPEGREHAMRLTNETSRTLMESTAAAIFFHRGTRFLYVNGAMEKLTGYSREDLVTMDTWTIVHPDHRSMVRERALARMRGESPPSRYEMKIVHRSGDLRWIDFTASIVSLDGGPAIMGTAVDITDRKKFEEELARSEELTHRLMEAIPGGVVEISGDGRVHQANVEAQRFCGLSALDFLKRSLHDLAERMMWEDGSAIDYEDVPAVKCLATGENQGPLTLGIRRPDGGISWGIFTAVPLMDVTTGAMAGAVQTFLDISSRKHMEDALRESEERYRKFFEEDLTGDFIASNDGCILACNPAFAAIFGFESVETAMYSNLNLLMTEEHPFHEIAATLTEVKKIEYHEAIGRRRDGRLVYVIENLIGLFDNDGIMVGVKGYVFDNTEHKLLEQHVQENAKIQGLGRLAGGIAHDFNNLLGIILGYSERLQRSIDAAAAQDARAIYTAAQRGASLVKQLLTFARKGEVTVEEMNLNAVVDELGRLLKETFPRTIDLAVDLDPDLPRISGDVNTIHQAILNLCVNARDAMPAGGVLLLRTETVGGADLRAHFADARAEAYACLSVSDTGVGMDEQTRGKIFEPFFSTKERTKGTGLGLAVVYGIVNSHHGFVDVLSQPGQGSTFRLYFPIPTSSTMTSVRDEVPASEASGGKETILVVEDEEALRDLLKALLESKGYTILTVCDGEQAVVVFEEHRDRIDLVLTDLGLPKLDGWSACKQMMTHKPDVKVIVASGYLDPEMKQDMVARNCTIEFVHKPYLPTELMSTVRSVLDRTKACEA